MTDASFDVLVVGAGLIGSAAARYLSRTNASVGLLGPEEPDDPERHDGVFASHYDEGRVTRVLDPDPVWAELARRSMLRYRSLERLSGLSFYDPCGYLRVGPLDGPQSDLLVRAEAVARTTGLAVERMDAASLARRFPFFRFPSGYAGLYESDGAGVINPRTLVRAQISVAEMQGATVLRDTAVATQHTGTGLTVRTRSGRTYGCRRLLLATGAFTNFLDILPRKLALTIRAETVLLAPVLPADLPRYGDVPTLWYDFNEHPSIPHVYLLPPLRYPDGRHYLKIGADFDPVPTIETLEEAQAHFRSGGNRARGAEIQDVLHSLMPDLPRHDVEVRPCMLTYPPHGRPVIDHAGLPGVFVATGGCGASAKSSDELGRMAALLVTHGSWAHDLDPGLFVAVPAGDA